MKQTLIILCVFIALPFLMIALAIWLGGPGTAPPMLSINDPFLKADFSAKPPLQTFKGADGVDLSFREYAAAGKTHKGSAVLVHGSSGSSESMHPMAQALAAAGVPEPRMARKNSEDGSTTIRSERLLKLAL